MAEIKLDPANVPSELHSLIPYAEKWGIRDQFVRESLLRQAPLGEIDMLYEAVYPLWNSLDQFTIFRAPNEQESLEVEAFFALRATLGNVYEILADHNSQRVLEIIGYPGAWPPMEFDHAKVPPELESLIPYAEKWVIDDQGVRDTVVKAAADAELEELLSAINQIGKARITELMYKMLDGELFNDAGYVFALLMDVVDDAEFRLRTRHPHVQSREDEAE